MSSNKATIIDAATAWAVALGELEAAKQYVETDGETPDSAELAMHSVAARVNALKGAERALYQAVKRSGAKRR
jgi:hypothetical protein